MRDHRRGDVAVEPSDCGGMEDAESDCNQEPGQSQPHSEEYDDPHRTALWCSSHEWILSDPARKRLISGVMGRFCIGRDLAIPRSLLLLTVQTAGVSAACLMRFSVAFMDALRSAVRLSIPVSFSVNHITALAGGFTIS